MGLAVVATALGYFACSLSLAEVTKKTDPDTAHRLAAYNGRVTADLALSIFQTKPDGSVDSPAAHLARLALRQDATAISALTVLGTQAQMRGNLVEARRIFRYSESLSRRNIQTQVWAIEEAVKDGDEKGALRHYDVALRVSRDASNLLFPVLTRALSDPSIQTNLIPILAKKPAWGPTFLGYALGRADPKNTLALFIKLRQAKVAIQPDASASLINRLLLYNEPTLAWNYYTSLNMAARVDRSRDPTFRASPASTSQFDWVANNDDSAAVTIHRSGPNGVVDFSMLPERDGVLLSQVQVLPPGEYLLSGIGNAGDLPSTSLPYWKLTCRDGRELGRVSLAPSQQLKNFNGRFVVPEACPVQTLSFIARPVEGATGLSGQISRAVLTPDRQVPEI
ncbi:hypothetical protein [Sphingomonas faeni]|uniref:hypothetical protein n=1 Tax=Sphingomonas faeni TaxID=185950 RepID=UPI0027D85D23|nr:hypothetical protein [Sphingomonas faeni]